ncbi:TatD family hydrolase [Salinibacillus xinjiangensis]|uniref:TatD family deoxyribonuclease n=1 Tax=Salinibacillus xinjiangensis TaxID=1229268 RepID=A0A6G1X453_9BACI|nr:TatD family hydrolase [Salinibacillus xinjiangensis]MRG85773.1 TatD family deoxyribonuclease [Salinibacillus xinjiangensis]
MRPIYDAHIHLDVYDNAEQKQIIKDMETYHVEGLITVSRHLLSAKRNLKLAQENKRIYPAFGFHPEQSLTSEQDIENTLYFLMKHQHEMVAVGEVGLPYYLRKQNNTIPIAPYIEILEQFIKIAKRLHKPIVLHAVYEDAPLVCYLLEKHSITKAHFHWFKGDSKTVERLIQNGYFISFTPDVCYKEKIQSLAKRYPISQTMVETDGPWPFEGPFQDHKTHPRMIHQSVEKIAELKHMKLTDLYETIASNTRAFYKL